MKIIKKLLEKFLKDDLDLIFNKKVTRIFPNFTGINFLGYIIFEKYFLPRKKTVLKMIKKMKKEQEMRFDFMESLYKEN